MEINPDFHLLRTVVSKRNGFDTMVPRSIEVSDKGVYQALTQFPPTTSLGPVVDVCKGVVEKQAELDCILRSVQFVG